MSVHRQRFTAELRDDYRPQSVAHHIGGGGTEPPSITGPMAGFLIAAAIDKYVYITLHKNLSVRFTVIKYSELERVAAAPATSDIRIVAPPSNWSARTTVSRSPVWPTIPAGTGLGSSGQVYDRPYSALCTPASGTVISPPCARRAGLPRRNRLALRPVGKQRQFISAYGGVTWFRIQNKDDSVAVAAASISHEVLDNLETASVFSSPVHAVGLGYF